MLVLTDPLALAGRIKSLRSSGERIGFVPTMGFLHAGHLSLVKSIRTECDRVVVSIFINPLQFNQKEDYQNYPIDLERDKALLKDLAVDLLFLPTESALYRDDHRTRVSVSRLGQHWEGAFRPGHFDGVTTVVALLFNIVQPDVAIFGEKDFQQLRLIEQMVRDLHMPVEIMRGELIRDGDGLALSSRNVRLSAKARRQALCLSAALYALLAQVRAGVTSCVDLINTARSILSQQDMAKLDYLAIVDEISLEAVDRLETGTYYRALVAATFDGIRLIDNIRLSR